MKRFFLVNTLLILAVFSVCFLGARGHAQQLVFTANCNGNATHDTAWFTTNKATVGSVNDATFVLPYKLNPAQRCKVNTLTLTANITLDNTTGSGIEVVAGQTLTVAGPRVNPIGRSMFYGTGATVLTGRSYASLADATHSGLVTTTTSNSQAVSIDDPRVPTQAENDALVGTSGTPSSSNKYVTDADTGTSGAGKVLRLDGSGKLPAVDGSQLTNLPAQAAQSTVLSACAGSNDTALITAAIGVGKPILIPFGVTCATNNVTISVPLYVAYTGRLKPNTGQTATLTAGFWAGGDISWQGFTNATAGQGTISFAGAAQAPVHPEWWGAIPARFPAVGVDRTAEIQAAIVAVETRCGDVDTTGYSVATGCGTLKFSLGDYSIGSGVSSGAVLTVTKGVDIVGEAGARLLYATLPNTVDVLRMKPNAGVSNVIDRLKILNIVIWPASANVSGRYALNFDLSNSNGFNAYYRNALIKDCYFGSAVNAIGVTNASGVGGIQASTFEHCFLYGGFNFTNAGDSLRVINCTVTGLAGGSPSIIDLTSGATGPYIFGMNDTNPKGLWVKSSMGGVIENSVYEPTAAGAGHNGAIIDIDGGGASSVHNFVVRNNVVTSVGGAVLDGVRVNTASTTATVEGNHYNLPAGKRAVYAAAGIVTIDPLSESDGSGSPPLYVADSGAVVLTKMYSRLAGPFSATGGASSPNFGDSSISTEALYVLFDRGKVITPAGTTGAQTINAISGSVNFAAGATSLVVTNSQVTTSTVVISVVASNDATMKSVQVVAGAGSFTVYANAAATAETRVNFWIVK